MDYFSWPDYLILAAFFVISLGIGVYHSLTGGRQRTTSEFIMANRSLSVIPTALSLLVSIQSAILILGLTAEMYTYGALYLAWTFISITLALVFAMQMAVPMMYPLKLVSVNEYYERRFNSKSVRILASCISIFSAILYMGSAMYAPSAALHAATGLPIGSSILVMAVVSVVYTALGGMRAVIWTDVFQSIMMFGGLLAILIKGVVVVGGFGNVFRLCSQAGRLNWTDWSPDPTVRHTVWGFVFGYTINWFNYYGFSQAAVQRYSATKTQVQAKLTIIVNLPVFFVLHLIMCLTGLAVVSYYASIGCDPLANYEIGNANELLPRFVLQMFADAPGFAGLFLTALYGGALSSISTSLSGSAANCWEDILQWKFMHWTESRKALFNRFLVVLFGVAATGLAFLAAVIPGPISQVVTALHVIAANAGPLFGLFVLGGSNRYANWKGALIGGITSAIGSYWLTIGSFTLKQRPHPILPPLSIDGCTEPYNLIFHNYDVTNSSSAFHFSDESPIKGPLQGLEKYYSISYLWYTMLWAIVTVFIGSVASFLLRDQSQEEIVDEKLLFSFRRCFQWGDVPEPNSAVEMSSLDDYKTVEFGIEVKETSDEPVKPHLTLRHADGQNDTADKLEK